LDAFLFDIVSITATPNALPPSRALSAPWNGMAKASDAFLRG
jgi:hypothetical protein